MRLALSVVLALVACGSTIAVAACGGADPLPPPPPPPPAMPQGPRGPAAAVDAAVETPPEAPVLLVSGAPAPEPSPAPSLKIRTPKSGQVVQASAAAQLPIKMDVKHIELGKDAARVHVLLDGRPAKTIFESKQLETLKLGELSTTPLGEGHHVVTAVLARASEESIKSADAFAVVELYVGKKTTPSVDLKKPHVVVTQPEGTYEGNRADHVLVDFFTSHATLGDGKGQIALELHGPGIQGSLRATTNRVVPYYLENLHAGSYTLRVEILGADGKPLANPWATTTRSITIVRGGSSTPSPASATAAAKAADAGGPRAESVPEIPSSTAGAAAADAAVAPRVDKPLKEKPKLERPPPPPPPPVHIPSPTR